MTFSREEVDIIRYKKTSKEYQVLLNEVVGYRELTLKILEECERLTGLEPEDLCNFSRTYKLHSCYLLNSRLYSEDALKGPYTLDISGFYAILKSSSGHQLYKITHSLEIGFEEEVKNIISEVLEYLKEVVGENIKELRTLGSLYETIRANTGNI